MVIKKVFGQYANKIPISALKSMIGHPIGASGAAEVAACAISIQEGFIPPTINLHKPDPACDLDYVPNQMRKVNIKKEKNRSIKYVQGAGLLKDMQVDWIFCPVNNSNTKVIIDAKITL